MDVLSDCLGSLWVWMVCFLGWPVVGCSVWAVSGSRCGGSGWSYFFVSLLSDFSVFCGEFDPGSGRTLAACLTHASRTDEIISVIELVANG